MNEQQIKNRLNQLRAELIVVTSSKQQSHRQPYILEEIQQLEGQLKSLPTAQGDKGDKKPIIGQPAAKNPDGSINWLGTKPLPPTATASKNPAPTGKGKPQPKKTAPPSPTATRNAGLLAGLPTQDTGPQAAPVFTPPKTTTTELMAAAGDPTTIKTPAVGNITKPQTVTPPANNKMGWQSYIGLGTDLVGGIMGMAMANKPLTPFRSPQAYDTMMAEVIQNRNQGLTATEQGMANERIQGQYNSDVASIGRIANGSAGLYLSGLKNASATAQSANVATSAMNDQIKRQNQQIFNNVAVQDMNREQAAYAGLRSEEMAAANAYAQAGAANFQQAGARIDYINQYDNPESFYNLLKQNMTNQISGWGSFLNQKG